MAQGDPLSKPVKRICPRCGYKWYSESGMDWVTCPHCQVKIKVP